MAVLDIAVLQPYFWPPGLKTLISVTEVPQANIPLFTRLNLTLVANYGSAMLMF